MLEALKELGELVLNKENKQPIDILLEDPDSNGSYKKVFVLNFDKNLGFLGTHIEEFKKEEYYRYLYRSGPSNGSDYSPTSRFVDPEKTINRMFKYLKDHQDISEIEKIYNQLDKNRSEIKNTIQTLANQSKDKYIITLKIDEKYLYDIEKPNFKNILLKDFLEKIKEISSKNSICSICGERKEEIFTTSEIYKFYTLDKECYIASGFDKKSAWKNFPICEECFLKIDYAKKIVEENLQFKFYGKSYYLIPSIIINTKEVLNEVFNILKAKDMQIKLKTKDKKRLTSDEKEIFDLIKDYKDALSFYMLFLKKDNSAERILLLIEDVLPSTIRKIFNAKDKVEEIFQREYNIGLLTKFLDFSDKMFFEIIEKIFRGKTIELNTMLQIFNRKIRIEFLQNGNYNNTTLHAIMNIKFLEELNIIKIMYNINKEVFMESLNFESVYKKLGKSLNTKPKIGIFLLGVLSQILMNIQYKERESTPFYKNLKGLRMNEEDIKGLLPKIINKFVEYDRYYKYIQQIAEEASKNLISEDKFNLSIDEINFYFASGMALANDVIKTIIPDNENLEKDLEENIVIN